MNELLSSHNCCLTQKEIDEWSKEIKNQIQKKHGFDDYANVLTEYEYEEQMKYEGPQKMFNHKEEFTGIDLTPFLLNIRNQSKEWVLLLAIKGSQVLDSITFPGKSNRIDVEDYFTSGAVKFITQWVDSGALICNYHNHPYTFAALPSPPDIENLSPKIIGLPSKSEQWVNAENKYKIFLPDDFEYDNWGVASKYDFFSSCEGKTLLTRIYDSALLKI